MFERVKSVIRSVLGGPDTSRNQTARVITKKEHGIDPRLVTWQAKRTCEALQQRGFKAYIVGGAVRDLLLGVQPKDFDVATNATPEQVKRAERRAYIIGRRFRLVHVVFGQEIIECSTFRALDARGVRKDADGRVISDNVFGSMWEDAARRDFTINALYYDPVTEEVFDYHHGFEDVRRGRLRMIGNPEDRYREDPVRMMRAVRIAGKLGFKMESATEKAIPKMASLLANVPAARLFDEMMKLFTCGKAEACLLGLRREKLLGALMPMLDVILAEPTGEEFLLLALRRTDERIGIGKKISPGFLFATLLWPQVMKRWAAYEKRPGMQRASALYSAAEDVLATQRNRLAIQARFIDDMRVIWMMQLRFERRTGKNPYSLIEHPKYRAGYDFMLLRSLLNYVPKDLVAWWEGFVAADEEGREAMIVEQENLARKAGAVSKGKTAKSKKEESFDEGVEEKPKRKRSRRSKAKSQGTDEVFSSVEDTLSIPDVEDSFKSTTMEAKESTSAGKRRPCPTAQRIPENSVSHERVVETADGPMIQVETKQQISKSMDSTSKKPRRRRPPRTKPQEASVESV